MLLFMTGADYGSCQEQLKGMLIERIAASGDENEFESKYSESSVSDHPKCKGFFSRVMVNIVVIDRIN